MSLAISVILSTPLISHELFQTVADYKVLKSGLLDGIGALVPISYCRHADSRLNIDRGEEWRKIPQVRHGR